MLLALWSLRINADLFCASYKWHLGQNEQKQPLFFFWLFGICVLHSLWVVLSFYIVLSFVVCVCLTLSNFGFFIRVVWTLCARHRNQMCFFCVCAHCVYLIWVRRIQLLGVKCVQISAVKTQVYIESGGANSLVRSISSTDKADNATFISLPYCMFYT